MASKGLPIAARLGVTTINDLYNVTKEGPFPGEDDNLEISKNSATRFHYTSLVVPLPEQLKTKINEMIRHTTEKWPKEVYYLQKSDNYHLTLASNLVSSLNENDKNILQEKVAQLMQKVLIEYGATSTSTKEPLCIKLTKLTISKASINCEAEAGNASSQRFYDILKANMKTDRLFHNQSVTLCRFLMPPDNETQRKKNGLILDTELRNLNTNNENYEVNTVFTFDKLAFICTDRLADDFKIIHSFNL